MVLCDRAQCDLCNSVICFVLVKKDEMLKKKMYNINFLFVAEKSCVAEKSINKHGFPIQRSQFPAANNKTLDQGII